MQEYYQIVVTNKDLDFDFVAELLGSVFPFDGLEAGDEKITCYLLSEEYNGGMCQRVASFLNIDISEVLSTKLPYTNYNAEWESNFSPIEVHDFVAIRAEFHEHDFDTDHTITIRPKMAFGTGHHATTWMMLDAMRSIDFKEKFVFDFGAGTGILSVMASMLGASTVVANDIQAEAMDNIHEHYLINNCEASITILQGGLEVIDPNKFDVILANINTVVLSQSANELKQLLKSGGVLLLSGILEEKEAIIKSLYLEAGFELQASNHRGDWCCLRLTH